jgi:hypothetical protein
VIGDLAQGGKKFSGSPHGALDVWVFGFEARGYWTSGPVKPSLIAWPRLWISLNSWGVGWAWRQTAGSVLGFASVDLKRPCSCKRGGVMEKAKRKRLEAKGWRVGTAAEFLGLTPEESAYVELKVALAKHMGSSQSRVPKLEAADPSVSLDFLIRSLIALGVTRQDLGRVIASTFPRVAA